VKSQAGKHTIRVEAIAGNFIPTVISAVCVSDHKSWR
jgi:hypothetical protein